MTSAEHIEYDRLTDGMEMDFIVLTESFMGYCEDIIFGNDFPEIKYYCFHLYNDNYTKMTFSKLSYRVEKLYSQTDSKLYPGLSEGFGNLLIYLLEPILRENDKDYIAQNYIYWRNQVIKDSELLQSGSFRKYLTVI